jgi:hypothetical protein
MTSEEVHLIGRMEQMDTILTMMPKKKAIVSWSMVVRHWQEPLPAEFEGEALQERFNVISFSANELDNELNSSYQSKLQLQLRKESSPVYLVSTPWFKLFLCTPLRLQKLLSLEEMIRQLSQHQKRSNIP